MSSFTTSSKGAASDPILSPVCSEYLTFTIANVNYGIDILKVQEIRAFEVPTRIPNAPHDIRGVLNLRGVIIPVVDLRLRLGLESAACDIATVTIILNLAQGMVGVVVDSVSDVVDLPANLIKPAPSFESGEATRHLTGIATLDQANSNRMLVLIDIDTVLTGMNGNLAPHPLLQ